MDNSRFICRDGFKDLRNTQGSCTETSIPSARRRFSAPALLDTIAAPSTAAIRLPVAVAQSDRDYLRSLAPLPLQAEPCMKCSPQLPGDRGGLPSPAAGPAAGRRRRRAWERLFGCLGGGKAGGD